VKRKILIAAGVLVAIIASAGVASAVTAVTAAPVVSGKACVTTGGVLKLATNSGGCPAGTKVINLQAKGAPGTVLGYAHIVPGNHFDIARSYNVTAANVVSTHAGFVCFKGLSFTPHNASVTLDYNGILNGQIPVVNLLVPAGSLASECGLTAAQAEVFTGLVTPTTFTAGTKLGFYIIFYA
jgi:hypothetical protein